MKRPVIMNGPNLKAACLLCIICVLVLHGCGYRLIGTQAGALIPGTVAVPVFRNVTYTATADEGAYTEAVIQALVRHGVQVRDVASAAFIVTGEVISFTGIDEAFSATDTPRLRRADAEIEITIRDRQKQTVVLRERFTRQIDYPAQTQRALQPNVDIAAVRELADQVAQAIMVRLLALKPGERTP